MEIVIRLRTVGDFHILRVVFQRDIQVLRNNRDVCQQHDFR